MSSMFLDPVEEESQHSYSYENFTDVMLEDFDFEDKNDCSSNNSTRAERNKLFGS